MTLLLLLFRFDSVQICFGMCRSLWGWPCVCFSCSGSVLTASMIQMNALITVKLGKFVTGRKNEMSEEERNKVTLNTLWSFQSSLWEEKPKKMHSIEPKKMHSIDETWPCAAWTDCHVTWKNLLSDSLNVFAAHLLFLSAWLSLLIFVSACIPPSRLPLVSLLPRWATV